MLLGKDNGLAYPLTALHPQASHHQVLQHLPYGVYIIYIAVYLVALDVPMIVRILIQRLACLFISPHGFHLLLLVLAQLVVSNAFLQDECSSLQGIVGHQVSVGHRFVQFVGKGIARIHLE